VQCQWLEDSTLVGISGGQFVGADHELADGSIKGEVPDVLLYFLQRFVKYFQFGPGGFEEETVQLPLSS